MPAPFLCSESKNASVAQSVEQGTENPRVDGSIPSGGTIRFKSRNSVAFFFYKMGCSVGNNMNALHSYAVTENPRAVAERQVTMSSIPSGGTI